MVLPSFAIVGTQKGGTTSLMRFLTRHPQVARSERKEVHFFDRFYDRGVDWYSDQFALEAGQTMAGDATPLYMYDPVVRDRMIATLPELRVVVTLRDPVARAYSHYWHSRRYGMEPLDTFEEALAAEPERLPKANVRRRAAWSYLDRGRYLGQLEALADAYGREAICITSLELMIADPPTELTKVMTHVGVDLSAAPALKLPKANAYMSITPKEKKRLKAAGEPLPADVSKKYPPINEDTKISLRDEFSDEDARLLQWLGWDELPWRKSAAAVT